MGACSGLICSGSGNGTKVGCADRCGACGLVAGLGKEHMERIGLLSTEGKSRGLSLSHIFDLNGTATCLEVKSCRSAGVLR
jgi:hypothetical protein